MTEKDILDDEEYLLGEVEDPFTDETVWECDVTSKKPLKPPETNWWAWIRSCIENPTKNADCFDPLRHRPKHSEEEG